jgi:cephalosporin hydroxylase
VDGWALSEFVLKKVVPVAGVHPFPLQELMLMCASVCRLQPSLIFEWGTNIGKSARIFFETTEHYGIPCPIHSIDLPDDVSHVEHPHEHRGVMVRGLKRVELHQGDGLETSLSVWKKSGSPSNPLFFIDGDHSYDSVLREIKGIITVIPGASILLHDTFFQSDDSGYNVGPHRAVSETIAKHPHHFQVVHTGVSLPGMTLLASRE